ncbi:MAG: T9SS type A sorting domain-containing protein [Winogradskyella sp.]|uniref:T9SS type A sorting domain-containing protein n=1 Tax=Winogradskyella sp. TaxID=1883156 RepID=UPI00385A5FA9
MRKITTILNFAFTCSLVFFSSFAVVAQSETDDNTTIRIDWDVCKYYPSAETHVSKINVPEYILQKMARGGSNCSTFIVNYNGFTPEAEAAFQFAVDIWSNALESVVPIRVEANFGPLDPGVLGGAGPAGFRLISVPGVPSNTAFPLALAEKLEASELPDASETFSNDINATFSSTANFYFGIDGNTPSNQIDFVSVVLHELGHGLGILGFGRVDDPDMPTEGVLRNNGFVNVWDNFIENGTPEAITSFADPSAVLLTELTGNNLFSNGPITTLQNNGIKPSTYAPAVFRQGSSYSHWDEATYPPGNANSLMTPFISRGEAIHDPGLVTLGFMEDMGWSICGGSLLSVNDFNLNTVNISPNPFDTSFTIEFNSNTTDVFNVSLVDINGRVILNTTKSAINGKLSISNLEHLKPALYFVRISNTITGHTVIKKLVKE